MKQNITMQDLADLNDRELAEYIAWCEDHGMSIQKQTSRDFIKNIETKELVYPLLSIGLMIEFLVKHKGYNPEYGTEPANCYGEVIIDWPQEGTLCDYLWQAVKEVLKND